MIKIPATVEGLPAIRASIAAGVNVTLVFSVARYREVVEAYLSGLEGREVVQVYASRPDSAVPRPRRWLVGFAAAAATAGEERTVPVVVLLRALQHWDDTIHAWRTEAGTFDLHVGPSAGDLPLHTAIEIPGS